MNVKANVKTLTSSEFEKDAARARQAADSGPVFIVSGGAVSHVLMTKAEFDRLDATAEKRERTQEAQSSRRSLADDLAYDGDGGDFEWEPPKMTFSPRVPDFD